jgi:hypothetical protein
MSKSRSEMQRRLDNQINRRFAEEEDGTTEKTEYNVKESWQEVVLGLERRVGTAERDLGPLLYCFIPLQSFRLDKSVCCVYEYIWHC